MESDISEKIAKRRSSKRIAEKQSGKEIASRGAKSIFLFAKHKSYKNNLDTNK